MLWSFFLLVPDEDMSLGAFRQLLHSTEWKGWMEDRMGEFCWRILTSDGE